MGMFKDLTISFRTIGRKGDIVFAVSRPVMTFRGMKLKADDDHGGLGTNILGIYIDGQRITPRVPWWRRLWARLKKRSLGIPTVVFGQGALGNGLGLPACPEGKEIAFEIEFLADGQWRGELHGKGSTVG